MFPEPKSFNGGPEDRPAFPPYGRRREAEDEPRDVSRPSCAWCATPCTDGYVSYAGVGIFCSHRHKEAYLELRDRRRPA